MITIAERYKDIIEDYSGFLESIKKEPPQTIRVNTLKITPQDLKELMEKKGWELEEIPYFDIMFKIKGNKSIANSLEHYLGYFYIQEIASLVPVLSLDPKPEDKILDLCAAPGGKTTFISQLMNNKGMVIANELNYKRQKALMSNIYRLGILNALVTGYNGLTFPSDIEFDKALVDVPCSAESRRIFEGKIYVNLEYIKRISQLQKALLSKSIDLVKKGGVVVYSTCTFAPEENEEVINHVLQKKDVRIEKIMLNFPHQKGITYWEGKKLDESISSCIRIYPHHLGSGAGFVAKLVKL